jgi:hypothetical protein
MNQVTKIRVNSWSNSLCALMPLWICPFSSTNVEDSLQISLFMQNKPNVKCAQINVNSYMKSKYENLDTWLSGKNKPNQTQFKPKTNPISEKPKMSLNTYPTKAYSNKTVIRRKQNKPKQTQFQSHFNKPKKNLWTDPKRTIKITVLDNLLIHGYFS